MSLWITDISAGAILVVGPVCIPDITKVTKTSKEAFSNLKRFEK